MHRSKQKNSFEHSVVLFKISSKLSPWTLHLVSHLCICILHLLASLSCWDPSLSYTRNNRNKLASKKSAQSVLIGMPIYTIPYLNASRARAYALIYSMYMLLTLSEHAQRGLRYLVLVSVCLFVCLSVYNCSRTIGYKTVHEWYWQL